MADTFKFQKKKFIEGSLCVNHSGLRLCPIQKHVYLCMKTFMIVIIDIVLILGLEGPVNGVSEGCVDISSVAEKVLRTVEYLLCKIK